MASGLTVFLMGLIFSISLYISFESDRFQVRQAVKSALRSTMVHCMNVECDPQLTLDQFASDIQWITERYAPIHIDLLGFNSDPLLIRLLGDAYMRDGKLQKALDTYRRALDLM